MAADSFSGTSGSLTSIAPILSVFGTLRMVAVVCSSCVYRALLVAKAEYVQGILSKFSRVFIDRCGTHFHPPATVQQACNDF
jgi:hypothetical protein